MRLLLLLLLLLGVAPRPARRKTKSRGKRLWQKQSAYRRAMSRIERTDTRIVVADLDQNSYDVDLEAERSAYFARLEDRRMENGRWLAPLLLFVTVRLA